MDRHAAPHLMRDFEVVSTVEAMKALADPVRLRMIGILTGGPATGSMLARELDIPANRAHYHLRRLADRGLVREVAPGPRGSTEERYFIATARHVLVDPAMAGPGDDSAEALRQSIHATFSDWRRANVLALDWEMLARHIVRRSLEIGPSDRVLVGFAPIALPLAEAVGVEVEAAGAAAHPRPWSRNVILRTLDRHDEAELRSRPFLPACIDDSLTAVVFITSTLVQGAPPTTEQRRKLPVLLESLSRWQRSLRNRGVRLLQMGLPHHGEFEHGDMTPEEAIDTYWRCVKSDPDGLRRRGEQLHRELRRHPELVIEDGRGGRLEVTVEPRCTELCDGVLSAADVAAGQVTDGLPAGRYSVLPVRGTATGTFTADYSFTAGTRLEAVRVELHEGQIMGLDASGGATVLVEQLERESGEPGTLARVSVGLNPAGSRMTGKPSLDSCLSGVVTLSFGNNELLGGDVRSTLDLSLPASGAILRAGTRELVRRGRLVEVTG